MVDTNLIKRLETYIPYATSDRRFLIATEPVHQRGNNFKVPVEYKDYYMEADKSYDTAQNHLRLFLERARIKIKY